MGCNGFVEESCASFGKSYPVGAWEAKMMAGGFRRKGSSSSIAENIVQNIGTHIKVGTGFHPLCDVLW